MKTPEVHWAIRCKPCHIAHRRWWEATRNEDTLVVDPQDKDTAPDACEECCEKELARRFQIEARHPLDRPWIHPMLRGQP